MPDKNDSTRRRARRTSVAKPFHRRIRISPAAVAPAHACARALPALSRVMMHSPTSPGSPLVAASRRGDLLEVTESAESVGSYYSRGRYMYRNFNILMNYEFSDLPAPAGKSGSHPKSDLRVPLCVEARLHR